MCNSKNAFYIVTLAEMALAVLWIVSNATDLIPGLNPLQNQAADKLDAPVTDQVTYIVLTGAFFFIVGALGLLGTWKKSRGMMNVYLLAQAASFALFTWWLINKIIEVNKADDLEPDEVSLIFVPFGAMELFLGAGVVLGYLVRETFL